MNLPTVTIPPKVFTVEFKTFVVYANSKIEAHNKILEYVKKQSVDLEGFFNMQAIVIEKEILAD